MKTRYALGIVLVAAAGVFFANLGGPRLWDRDEPRTAGCAAEMLQRGDWVTPVFNDELRSHKPVMLYWLMMSSYSVFGVNEFAARFWSAALALLTVMMTYGIGRRLLGHREGVWSAIALSTTLMFDVAARAATPDSTLIFFSTLAIWLFVVGAFRPVVGKQEPAWRRNDFCYPGRWWQVALMFVAMSGGVLTKGPVGLVLPTAVLPVQM